MSPVTLSKALVNNAIETIAMISHRGGMMELEQEWDGKT
jgi:hypothetical protein